MSVRTEPATESWAVTVVRSVLVAVAAAIVSPLYRAIAIYFMDELLKLLQANALESREDIAKMLGVPAAQVSQRIADVDEFYNTTDIQKARDFLRKYNVRYIIVGQQERGHNPGPGLQKFADLNGLYWREVYREGDTVIYEVAG